MSFTISANSSSANLDLPDGWYGSFLVVINGSNHNDPSGTFVVLKVGDSLPNLTRLLGRGIDLQSFGDSIRVVVESNYVTNENREFTYKIIGQ
jgi:hypothetical protein